MSGELITRWNALVASQPDALAVVDAQGKPWTFAVLDAMARRQELIFAKLPLHRHAALLQLPNSPEWLATLIALRRLGCVVVPVDHATSEAERARIGESIRAAAVITETGTQTLHHKAKRWKPGTALLKLTSGSTGTPKPIPFTERELCADGDNIQATMGFDANDRNFALLPLGHSYALGNLVVPLLAGGVSMVLGSAAFPRAIAEEIAAHRATVFPSVPPILEALARTDDLSLAPLRLVISAAAPLSPELAQRFHDRLGLTIHNFYGASECGGIAYDRTGDCGLRGDAVGTAMEGVSLSQSPTGELRVCSNAVSSYGRAVDATGRATITLSDKVTFDGKARLIIHGRTDRTIKCAGKRVDLAAIESVAATLSGMPRAAVKHDTAADRILIFVEGNVDTATLETELKSRFSTVAGRMRIKQLPKLPVTLRGKLDYRGLK